MEKEIEIKYHGIFDSHAHYDDDKFDEDREELLKSLADHGVEKIINIAADMESCKTSCELAEKYDFVYSAAGVHPHAAEEVYGTDYLTKIEEYLSNKKVVAIGEIGLDYHYDFSPRDIQRAVFEEQLALAKQLDVPVVIHSREATEDTLELLKKYRPKGVVHCFSGSAETAAEMLKLGLYIGFTGAVTFKNASKLLLAAQSVPLDRLLIETDCPYMTPVPHRGKRCDSRLVYLTAEKLAELHNVDTQQLIDITHKNTVECFEL
ncbi:MAG: TatD family hydrolase [Oscillospiraceae bacterium]|nr:TatD family hydrolase [Oscillospiraceae bacterium]